MLCYRDMSLAVILLKAGLGLDPVALRKLSGTVLSLAVCPGLMEALAVALMTHYFLDYPWLWGLALGYNNNKCRKFTEYSWSKT